MTTNSPWGEAQGISERFRARAAQAVARDVELLPSRLAVAVREVLACAGAGLSVMSEDFRVPLGASDDTAAALERLQFTAEQGPCWDAIRTDVPVAADARDIEARWPQFAAEMGRATSYRSVVSVPVRLARGAGGAMDLYLAGPDDAGRFDLDDGTVAAAHVADLLNREAAGDRDAEEHALVGPAWARGAVARGRLAVWIAVGMVMSELQNLPSDGLALLRAAAYSAGRSVDEIAADVVARRVGVADLLSA